MRSLIFILCFLISKLSLGQVETPAIGLSGGGVLIKKDSSGYFYSDPYDTTLSYFIAKDFQDYRLWKNRTNLILSGNLGGLIFTDYCQKFGEWKEYYENGKLKIEGSYDYNNPVGRWNFYFPNGKIKKWFMTAKIESDSITSYCKVGRFEEFYENGNIRNVGFYKVAFDTLCEAMSVPDGDDGNMKVIMARGHRSVPDMTWVYYKLSGEIERKVKYYSAANKGFCAIGATGKITQLYIAIQIQLGRDVY